MQDEKQPITAQVRGTDHVRITVNAEVELPLTERDVTNWLTVCSDPEALDRIAKYARYCAASIRNQSDENDVHFHM